MENRRELRREEEPFLPFEIIMEIIIRLPAIDALKFRCVCKRGSELIADRDFMELHFTRYIRPAAPMILVMKDHNGGRLLLDNNFGGEERTTSSIILKFPQLLHRQFYRLRLSQNGLIVLENQSIPQRNYFIFNPLYRPGDKVVTLTVPSDREGLKISICGVFYHSSQKEYSTLWEITTNKQKQVHVQYNMLNLGSESSSNWREITTPTWVLNNNYTRIKDITPALVNNKYLYWVVEEDIIIVSDDGYQSSYDKPKKRRNIMEFDTTNEQFEIIPYPINVVFKCYEWKCSLHNTVVDDEGVLSLVHFSDRYKQDHVDISVWTLKDRLKKLWTCSHEYVIHKEGYITNVVALLNGENLVFQAARQLFICDLRQETIRKFGRKYEADISVAHVMTLASLQNCKSEIHMEENDNWPRPS